MLCSLILILAAAALCWGQLQQHFSGDGVPVGYCSNTRYTDLQSGLTYKCNQTTHLWEANGASFSMSTSISAGIQAALDLKANTSALAPSATTDTTNAANISAGILPNARFPATLPAASAANLTTIPAANLSGVVPFANGGGSAAATPATTGTMTISMVSRLVTITPTGAATFNASGGTVGQIAVFAITTSGVSSFTLTWGTNFKTAGTLATGTTTAKKFSVAFICVDGTLWQEISRTPAM